MTAMTASPRGATMALRKLGCGLVLLPAFTLVSTARDARAEAAAAATTQCGGSEPGALITAIPGDLPIVLTSPHGGTLGVPDTPARRDTGARTFVTLRDTNTAELTERLADAIERELGKRP